MKNLQVKLPVYFHCIEKIQRINKHECSLLKTSRLTLVNKSKFDEMGDIPI